MPRGVTTGTEAHRQRQRRYRVRLRTEGRPEASMVDVAVAFAVADYWTRVQRLAAEGRIARAHPGEVVQDLARVALDRLVAAGFGRKPATRAVRQRLSRYDFQPCERHPEPRS